MFFFFSGCVCVHRGISELFRGIRITLNKYLTRSTPHFVSISAQIAACDMTSPIVRKVYMLMYDVPLLHFKIEMLEVIMKLTSVANKEKYVAVKGTMISCILFLIIITMYDELM